MPAPFPGMDPFLEGSLWTSFHALFVTEIIRLLNPQLRPRYVALAQQYQEISIGGESRDGATHQMYPDVGVAQTSSALLPGGTTAIVATPLQLTLRLPYPVPHPFIEIHDVQKRRLVTVIEFLSPANKRAPGRRKYQRKRQRLLDSSAHLLEIDLLHQGHRIPIEEVLPECPYFVFLSRVDKRPTVEVWPIPLTQALPNVLVPLANKDPDVSLDLQQAFTEAYDLGGFADVLDYTAKPPATLRKDEAAFVDEVLRASGKRL